MYYSNREKYPLLTAHIPDRPELFDPDTFIVDESYYGKEEASITTGLLFSDYWREHGVSSLKTPGYADFVQEAAAYFRSHLGEVEADREKKAADYRSSKRADEREGWGITKSSGM